MSRSFGVRARVVWSLAWVVSVWAGGVARADPQVTRATVAEALSGVEQGPDEAEVRGWGRDGVRWLMALAGDAGALHHVRVRAVHSLGVFGADPREGARVRGFLRAVASLPEQDVFLQRAAFEALVSGCGDVGSVAVFLRDARVDARDGAAWALSRSTRPEARAALVEALRAERDPTVRRTLTEALQRPPR